MKIISIEFVKDVLRSFSVDVYKYGRYRVPVWQPTRLEDVCTDKPTFEEPPYLEFTCQRMAARDKDGKFVRWVEFYCCEVYLERAFL